jgi:NADPH2:quinone reductase
MAYNGRHLIIGFASGIEEEERPLPIQPSIYGNFDLVGICFAYAGSPRPARPFGMNFLSTAEGIDIWNRILHLTRAGAIRPVIGRQIEFEDVPAELEALERRETTGRTVVRPPPDGT